MANNYLSLFRKEDGSENIQNYRMTKFGPKSLERVFQLSENTYIKNINA